MKRDQETTQIEIPCDISEDVWCYIVHKVDQFKPLRITSRFFAYNTKVNEIFLNKLIEENFDFTDKDEFSDYIQRQNFINQKSNEIPFYKELSRSLHAKFDKAKTVLESVDFDDYLVTLKSLLAQACRKGYMQIFLFALNTALPLIKNLKVDCINEKTGFEGRDAEKNALGYAAYYGRKKMFSLLLKNEAQFVNGNIPDTEDVALISSNIGPISVTMTPLHIIALRTDEKWLLSIFDEFPHTLSQKLFTDSYRKCLRLIIEDQDQQLMSELKSNKTLLHERDVADWTLLHWASCLGKINCMEVLIAEGSNLDDEDISPLLLSCATGSLDAIKKLVNHNAKIERSAEGMDDTTCLHITAYYGYSDCCRYFVEECQLDVNFETCNQETPLSLILRETNDDDILLSSLQLAKKEECAKVLIELGAKESFKCST